MSHHLKSNETNMIVLDVTPEFAGWDYLSYRVVNLAGEQTYFHTTGDTEIAIVPLSGQGAVDTGGYRYPLSRKSVFTQKPHVVYVPPGHDVAITTETRFEFAVGGAPADGKYPLRLFTPDEMKSEVRGGGAATRQVNHILAYPLPAERLILFEVYVPGGSWSGYPPHCHDGYGGSKHLDETYYFRMEPENGVALHRNYRVDTDFEEIFAVKHKDLVLVTQGFHSTAAAPASNVYFLNYLAGELYDKERSTPPYDDPEYAWIKQDYTGNLMKLPIVQ